MKIKTATIFIVFNHQTYVGNFLTRVKPHGGSFLRSLGFRTEKEYVDREKEYVDSIMQVIATTPESFNIMQVIATENQPVRWTTPLGLPVVQPYFKTKCHIIKISLQVLALQREGSTVEVKKQRTTFPPNFVHSLDGTHMMMTAVACRDAGLRFAGVHDSFWTHACDIDKMNQILREKFVELYSMPILENLLESFQTTYPGLEYPPVPLWSYLDSWTRSVSVSL